MPGYLLHYGALVLCPHAGQAQLIGLNPRVKVMGQPVVVQALPTPIAGCTNPPPPVQVGPCITAIWKTASTRIKVMGQPILLEDSQSTCLPTNASLITLVTQKRVKGT